MADAHKLLVFAKMLFVLIAVDKKLILMDQNLN